MIRLHLHTFYFFCSTDRTFLKSDQIRSNQFETNKILLIYYNWGKYKLHWILSIHILSHQFTFNPINLLRSTLILDLIWPHLLSSYCSLLSWRDTGCLVRHSRTTQISCFGHRVVPKDPKLKSVLSWMKLQECLPYVNGSSRCYPLACTSGRECSLYNSCVSFKFLSPKP